MAEAATASTDAPVQEPSEEIGEARLETGWEFFETPTVEAVKLKLESLPAIHGIKPVDFWEYVQPLGQSKNISTVKGQRDYREVWNLYVTVAGRIAMITQAALLNGWSVDFVPEPQVPPGNAAGYLIADDNRIVYREYVEITRLGVTRDGVEIRSEVLGRKPGTAWVPASGGAGAVSSNRFEKVETSARGRAIAAWGFGVLPGSGVASLEEMLSMNENRAADQGSDRPRGGRRQQAAPAPNREEVVSEVYQLIAELEEVTGLSTGGVEQKVIDFSARTFGRTIEYLQDGPLDLSPLKVGEVVVLRNRMQKEVTDSKNEQREL